MADEADRAGEYVSIRSRLFSREIRVCRVTETAKSVRFQSAPGFLAGRYDACRACRACGASFNPLPAF